MTLDAWVVLVLLVVVGLAGGMAAGKNWKYR
jgi:hypothetical protein